MSKMAAQADFYELFVHVIVQQLCETVRLVR